MKRVRCEEDGACDALGRQPVHPCVMVVLPVPMCFTSLTGDRYVPVPPNVFGPVACNSLLSGDVGSSTDKATKYLSRSCTLSKLTCISVEYTILSSVCALQFLVRILVSFKIGILVSMLTYAKHVCYDDGGGFVKG